MDGTKMNMMMVMQKRALPWMKLIKNEIICYPARWRELRGIGNSLLEALLFAEHVSPV